MDVRYINPFVEAVQTVFSTMIQIDVTLGKPHVTEALPRYDISGIIGMSGDVTGAIVLSFPAPVAKVV
ncbi:MAG TPA: chemotaxis protein CheX, partial [Phycisphaerales bacterium]|nr:chemotaxis protein CheX [Phycisphaerales bacterium]